MFAKIAVCAFIKTYSTVSLRSLSVLREVELNDFASECLPSVFHLLLKCFAYLVVSSLPLSHPMSLSNPVGFHASLRSHLSDRLFIHLIFLLIDFLFVFN